MSRYYESGESSDQPPVYGSDLFGGSLKPQLAWIFAGIPGQPQSLVGPIGEQKGIYHSLENTYGELSEIADPVEDVESQALEQLMANSVGHAINGWEAGLWYKYQMKGKPRISRVSGSSYTPTHLAYAISDDSTIYSIKKAVIRDDAECISYPYALSNLISITIRQHGLNTRTPLRHFIFYNVVNEPVWTAMRGAFHAMGVRMPVLPAKSMYEEEQVATGPRASRFHSAYRGKSQSKKSHRQINPAVSVTISRERSDAWYQLHANNPFTKALAHVRGEIPSLPQIPSYTLIAVAQDHFQGQEQMYWCALIAHLAFPAVAAGKGKGKEGQYDNTAGQYFSGASRHSQR